MTNKQLEGEIPVGSAHKQSVHGLFSPPTSSSSSSSSSSNAPLRPDLALLDSLFEVHPDYPQPGVIFRDIFPVFRNPKATAFMFNAFAAEAQSRWGSEVSAVVGLESRGFLLAPQLALQLQVAFVPVRKAGKLPGDKVSVSYTKEYGKDVVEIAKGSIKQGQKCVLIDDLLATGGSMAAAVDLVRKAGGEVVGCFFVVELLALEGRKKLGDIPTFALLTY